MLTDQLHSPKLKAVLAVLLSSKLSILLLCPNQVQELVGDNHKGYVKMSIPPPFLVDTELRVRLF